jgi:hypothetical protein
VTQHPGPIHHHGYTLGDPGNYPPAPRRRRRGLLVTLAAVVLMLVICLVGAVQLAGTATPDHRAGRPNAAALPADACGGGICSTPIPTVAPAAVSSIHRKDITLTVATTKKECFGSAGCLVTFRIKAAWPPASIAPDGACEVTYSISGLSDPFIGTVTLSGDGTYETQDENSQTDTASVKLRAAATGLECR